MEHRAAPVDRLEHDEVVEVPVQHAGQLELAEVAEVELHRAGAQAEAVGGLDQLLEEMPLSDTEKRRRSSIRPVWWPW